jgi:uncharacterized protein (UPF0305 family)
VRIRKRNNISKDSKYLDPKYDTAFVARLMKMRLRRMERRLADSYYSLPSIAVKRHIDVGWSHIEVVSSCSMLDD